MKSMTLRAKMIIGGMAIVVVPLFVVGLVIFFYLSNSLEMLTKRQSTLIARDLAKLVQATLHEEIKLISAFSVDPKIVEATSSGRFDETIPKLTSLVNKIGADYESIMITDEKGVVRSEVIDIRRIGIDVSDRDYFRNARQGKISVGTPVISKATGQPICVVAAPIVAKNGTFVGTVCGILKIDFLLDLVNSVKIGETGYPFILDAKGIVIAHPVQENILKLDATKLPGVAEIAGKMIRQETGTDSYTYQGVKKMAGFAPVTATGWSIAVTQNRDEFMAPANDILHFVLLSCCIFLAITIVAVYFFSGSISTPIQKTLSTLNKAIEQSEEVFAIIGRDRNIQFVNPAMERLTGYPASDLIGLPPLLDNTKQTPAEEIWRSLEHGNIWAGCISGTSKNETPFSLEVTITPIRDDRGIIDSYLQIGRDITRELRMEAQLRQVQKMEAIGTLAGGIAHDFNNILSAIYGYAELAAIPRADPTKTSHYIQGILNAAGRARDLVSQILTFSRQTEQENRPLEPKYLIRETLKLLRASLPTTIEIQESMNSSSLLLGDPTQLHQVIMNLCTNAAHAMHERGGVLTLSLDDVMVDENFVSLHPGLLPGKYIRLKVTDTGHGIAAENLERIFDPFFTTKPHGEGTGLGLSVVHGIVKSFKGIITVYSEIGKGTEFTVYFPAITDASVPAPQDDIAVLPHGTERVLLIDDEVNITNVERDMLEYLGYRVTVFNESVAALEHFRNSPDAFDVVITDYTMPQMTGLDLAGQLRMVRNDIPIILCSGHFDILVEQRADELGMTERLRKPITNHELATAIRKLLQKASA